MLIVLTIAFFFDLVVNQDQSYRQHLTTFISSTQ